MEKSILVFGGTIDPPHKAHIMLLEKAAEILKPSKIIIVPAYRSPFKNFPYIAFEHRKRMISLLIESSKIKNICEISDFEKRKRRIVYTVEVLKHFSKKGKKLYFLMGSDSFSSFHKWKNYKSILKMTRLVVGIRKGIKKVKRKYGSIFLKGSFPDISSTNIRKEIFNGNWNNLDKKIKKYIFKNNLYNALLLSKIVRKLTKKRLFHARNTAKLAIELAERNDIPVEKAAISAFLHDIAKDLPIEKQIKMAKYSGIDGRVLKEISQKAPAIIHQWAGKYLAHSKFKINDTDILDAISCHATACKKMSKLAKLIYVADFAGYDRTFSDALKVRKIAFLNLDKAFETAKKLKKNYIKKAGLWLYETE